MQVQIRYFSKSCHKVISHHLQTSYIDHARAEDLLQCINQAIGSFNLTKDRLVMLGSDGPNVNKKVFNLLNTDLEQVRGKGLLQVGTCNIHICHNSFLKGNKAVFFCNKIGTETFRF